MTSFPHQPEKRQGWSCSTWRVLPSLSQMRIWCFFWLSTARTFKDPIAVFVFANQESATWKYIGVPIKCIAATRGFVSKSNFMNEPQYYSSDLTWKINSMSLFYKFLGIYASTDYYFYSTLLMCCFAPWRFKMP